MAVLSYLGKSLMRNKKRTLSILLGVAISISLMVGLNIALDTIGSTMYKQNFDSIYPDLKVTSTQFDGNFTNLRNTYEPLKSDYKEITDIFASTSYELSLSTFNFENQPINWTYFQDRNYNNSLFSDVFIYGIDSDILNQADMHSTIRFNDNSTFSINASKNEVYLDISLESKYNLTVGQQFSLGYLFQFYNYTNKIQLNYTSSMENLTIKGFFTVLDQVKFQNLFPSQNYEIYGENNVSYALTSPEYAYTIKNQVVPSEVKSLYENYYSYYPQWLIGIVCNHTMFNFLNPNSITTFYTSLGRDVQYLNPNLSVDVTNNGLGVIQNVGGTISIYKTISVLISLPLIILGWILIKTNYFIVLVSRRREIGLLKCKSASKRQLYSIFYSESIILGLIGGLFGIVLGLISAQYIINEFGPSINVYTPFSISNLIQNTSLTTYIIALGLGAAISFFSSLSPVRSFVKMNTAETLQKYHVETQTRSQIKRLDWTMLVISLYSIFFAIWFDASKIINLPVWLYSILSILSISSIAIAPLAPFMLTYALVKLICYYSLPTYSRMITKISSIFNKKINFFTSRTIIRNRARSSKIVFIIAMALSFLIITDGLNASQAKYRSDLALVNLGGDSKFIMYSYGLLGNLNESLTSFYVNNLTSNKNLNISSMIPLEKENYLQLYGFNSYNYVNLIFLSSENYSKNYDDLNRFIVGGHALEVFSKLKSTPNSTLVSSVFLEQYNFKVGDSVIIKNNDDKLQTLKIVGEYISLPGIMSYSGGTQNLVCDISSMNNASINSIDFLVKYNISDRSNSTLVKDQINVLNQNLIDAWYKLDPSSYVYYTSGSIYNSNSDTLVAIFSFMGIEKSYLFSIVALGLVIIMYVSVKEKTREFGLLRAKGVDKKTIFSIQISEGAVYLTLGSIISLTGIFCTYALNRIVNNSLIGYGVILPNNFVIPWVQIVIELSIAISVFIIIMYIATYYVTKKSSMSEISEIFRMA